MISPNAFLQALQRGGTYGYWWTKPADPDNPAKESIWWPITRPAPIPRGEKDVYFGVHPVAEIPKTNRHGQPVQPKNARSQNAAITAINCLYADFDASDFGDDLGAALEHITNELPKIGAPEPSVIIASGGGFHTYWLLAETWELATDTDRESATALQEAWPAYVGADRDVKDLARILRVPGTVNYKYDPPRPVEFLSCDLDRRYALGDLAALVPAVEDTSWMETDRTPVVRAGDDRERRYAVKALAGEAEKVRQATDSGKHLALLNAAIAAAGFVPLISEEEIEDTLYAASTHRNKELANARGTIKDGIGYGSAPDKLRNVPPPPPRTERQTAHEPEQPSDPESDALSERYTDLGNARRLVRLHGENIRYVESWESWFIWDGTRWVKDVTSEIYRLAINTIEVMHADVLTMEWGKERTDLLTHATRSESSGKVEAMINLAQKQAGIAVHHEHLDSDPYLLNTQNGTINLRRGELQRHKRTDLITKRINVAFNPAAPAPTWLAFLDRIMGGKTHMVDYLQRAVGYSLTGVTLAQCLFFMHGKGRNGKSTFSETIMALFGDYAQKAPTEMLMQKQNGGGIPNDVARLPGARFVLAAEVEEGKRLAESLVKDLTGGDTMSARFMRQEFFDFTPTHKLWLYGNHKPAIRGTDNGIWRRIKMIPFTAPPITDEEVDVQMPSKLQAELSGVLAWAVVGCREWQANGLQDPPEVTQAVAAYRAEMDVLAMFLDDTIVESRGSSVLKSAVYAAYKNWCEANGEHPLKQRTVSLMLQERGWEGDRSNGKHIWRDMDIAVSAVSAASDPDFGITPKNSSLYADMGNKDTNGTNGTTQDHQKAEAKNTSPAKPNRDQVSYLTEAVRAKRTPSIAKGWEERPVTAWARHYMDQHGGYDAWPFSARRAVEIEEQAAERAADFEKLVEESS